MTEVRVFADPEALGAALAQEIMVGIDAARRDGRWFVLGCPGGRSARSTYGALARLAQGADLRHLVIAMMDDYVERGTDGEWRRVPAGVHYSCERFARDEIVALLDAAAEHGIEPDHVWLPDPGHPPTYRQRLEEAGGVDHFIVASGASDGHVAFVKPGSPIDGDVSIIELADSTRRDNMGTFPEFAALDDVPTHGVSVGLGTIISLSRAVTLVVHGEGKQLACERVLASDRFDPAWPATFIHHCREGRIWVDEAARGRP